MTIFNNPIQHRRETVTSIVSKLREKDYFVDEGFQRKLIWTQKQKVKLIETILMGYPMPEIYLWSQKPDPETGKQRLSIVDGQQRLTTILQFVSGEWALNKNALDQNNQKSEYVNKYWTDLAPALKQKIWEYEIDIRGIPSDIEISTIHKIFARLNQTDKSLNPAEFRNAVFHGQFIKASADIANKLNKYQWGIFSDSDMRRMKDIDFSSQLLAYLIQGISGTTPTVLYDIYDRYNDSYSNRKKHFNLSLAIFEEIEGLFKTESITRFFSKPIHFYTLFAVIDFAKDENLNVNRKALEKFVNAYSNADYTDAETDNILVEYKRGSSSSTAGKANRERRIYALLDFLRDEAN